MTESRTLLFDGARGQRLAGRLDLPLRLLDIADRCPIHRTLHSEVLVSTTQAVLGGESC